MRVAVDYRILSDPLALLGRGIGRFTQQQLREVLRGDGENEYLIMCPSGSDRSGILPEVLAAPNLEALEVDVPGFLHPPAGAAAGEPTRALEGWIRRNRIDVFHLTCPFALDQTDFPDFDACAMVATVYDLIPYIFADLYLVAPDLREAYMRAKGAVLQSARILAISRTTANDVAMRWGYPHERLDVTPPFAADWFRPLPAEVRENRLQALRARIGLPGRFALTVSAPHPAKNLLRLLEAYSVLPQALRSALPLVVCCHLEPEQVQTVRDACERWQLENDVLLTGYVSDKELVALYNAAELLLHPSRYEGFGLPVLEAMQCGTPVVAGHRSSLPEVAGIAAVLVDADDVDAIAHAVVDVAGNPHRREAMRRAGLERARTFSAERLGRTTLEAYRAAVSSPVTTAAGG